MKSIQQRIARPLIWTAVIVPLSILLVFNGIMRLYLLDSARVELRETTAVIETLVRDQLKTMRESIGNALDQTSLEAFTNIRSIVRATSRTTSTDILITDKNGVIVFPKDSEQLDMAATALIRLQSQLSEGLTANQTARLNTAGGVFLYQGFPLRPTIIDKSPWVICLVRYDPSPSFLLFTNLVLLSILVLGSLISIMITIRTAKRISSTLRRLHLIADRIGQGEFASGKPDHFCLEVSELQTQINAMSGSLAQADKMQKTFLQNASHELRTPLMTIQGYAEGLSSGVLIDVPKAAAIISSESHRLNQLVESLLTLSRIEHQSSHVTLTPLQLNDWLLDQTQRAQGLVFETEKTISLLLPPEAITIQTDEELLSQAVNNILSNAVRFAKTEVIIQSGHDSLGPWIAILDDGPGISQVDLPHIFDRFYKGSQGQYGLGLAIASSAVAALHGTLTAAGRPSGGAIFTIHFQ